MNNQRLISFIKSYISIFGSILALIIPIISPFIITAVFSFSRNSINWIIFIVSLIIFVIFFVLIKEVIDKNQAIYNSIVELLSNEMKNQSELIPLREGRVFPDEPMVNLKIFLNAMDSIKSKGYLEFTIQNMGMKVKKDKSLYLYAIQPGMSKYFMILTQSLDGTMLGDGCHGTSSEYILINNPSSIIDVDDRDYTETWVNHIFPLLGHLSDSISEKLKGGIYQESDGDFYVINKYKIINKSKGGKKQKFDLLRIYI